MNDRKLASLAGARLIAAPGVDGKLPPSNATEQDLALINALPGVLVPLAAEDVYVRHMEAINDRPLKIGWRVPADEVRAMARLARLRPVCCNHDIFGGRDALPVGTVFATKVEQAPEDGATVAVFSFFMARTAGNTELVQRIDGGNITEQSVSFYYDELICNICAGDYSHCAHLGGEAYDGKVCMPDVRGVQEFVETSLVYEGAAQGTRFRMAASAAACAEPQFPGKPRPGSFDAFFAARRPPLTWGQFFSVRPAP